MKILRRIKNLWFLSGLESSNASLLAQKMIKEFTQELETPKMAQIVKMEKPIDKFLNNQENE